MSASSDSGGNASLQCSQVRGVQASCSLKRAADEANLTRNENANEK